MYLYRVLVTKQAMETDFFIPQIATQEEINKSSKIEIWASNFKDEGEDYMEFRFFEENSDSPFKNKRVNGY